MEPDSGSETSETYDSFGELKSIIANQSHLFVCGGVIPITPEPEPAPALSSEHQEISPADAQRVSAPVTIRWDAPSESDPHACSKLTLPVASDAGDIGSEDIERLMKHAQPATFGLGGEDVLDESYRKALKIDTDAFCSTFDPYSLGIIDTIAQVLLPSVIDSKTHRSVKAELYKLNIYSGPSGKFKSHVDTPRSASQFGSLVVCLPVEHEGGQLKVRHKSKEMTYDWSTRRDEDDHASIRWAAFYSDCEHEILDVTSGHRLTLTYNLYAVRGMDRLTGISKSLDPTLLPLYQAVEAAMVAENRHFDGKAGTLGFWCTHVYAYNHSTNPLPDTLKGVDAVIWEVFRALGFDIRISAIVDLGGEAEYIQWSYDEEFEDKYGKDPEEKLRHGYEANMPTQLVEGPLKTYLHHMGVIEGSSELHDLYTSKDEWGGTYFRGPATWLNAPPSERELQVAYPAYGNYATTEFVYSHCAILIKVPEGASDDDEDDNEEEEEEEEEEKDCGHSGSE